MILNIFFIVVGNLTFLFLFWKRLKEDYIPNQIFSTAFYVLVGVLVLNILARRLYPQWWFWLGVVGIVVGLTVGIIRYRLRFMETLEAAVISTLPGLGIIFLSDATNNSSLHSATGALIVTGLIALFFTFDKHYKRFTWYRSGRIGFSGLTVLGLLFLIRAAVAVTFPTMLSFSGKYEVFLSSLVAFASFLGVFNLARQQT